MSKYIVKNCPAFVLMRTATSGTYFDICGNAKGHIKCVDCTDCILKQIVKKCKKSLEVSYCPIEQEILQLLDIQEMNDAE